MAKGHAAVAPRRREEASRPLLRTALCAAALGVIAVVLLAGRQGGAERGGKVELGVEANLISQEAVTNHKSDSSAKAINKAATAAVATIVKDDKRDKTSLASSSKKQSLEDDAGGDAEGEADMSREIKELAKQEKIHFAARQKALKAAVKATSNCKPDAKDYKACMQARKHVDWKMAKDKYEQAAMSDISKETDKEKASEAGELMFNKYRLLAGALSGHSQLSQLYNQTRTADAAKNEREEKAIESLKKEEKELQKVRDQKAALRHKKQEEMQAKANAEEHKSLKAEQDRIMRSRDYNAMYKEAAKGDAARQSVDAQHTRAYQEARRRDTASKAEIARIDANPYEADLKAAEKAEKARREAFDRYVREMRAQDAKDRADRDALRRATPGAGRAEAAKPKAAKQTKVMAMAQKPAAKYSSDVAKALSVNQQQASVEEAVVEMDQAAHAKAEEKRSLSIANGGAAARSIVRDASGRVDVTSSEAFERQLEEAKAREAARVAADGRARDEAREARAEAVRKLDDASRKAMVSELSRTADRIVGMEEAPKPKAKPAKKAMAGLPQ